MIGRHSARYSSFACRFAAAPTTVRQSWSLPPWTGSRINRVTALAVRGEQLRFLLAALVLAVALRFGLSLVMAPADPFSIAVLGAGGLV